jgi:ribosomal protein S12 methylthiotransferase accessory factor YcaO
VANSYYLDIHPVYYAINLKSITNPKLKELIANIQKDNTLYIIDFSYNYGTPVLCGLVVNKKNHTISVDLGSAPIFDIACERVLTELY